MLGAQASSPVRYLSAFWLEPSRRGRLRSQHQLYVSVIASVSVILTGPGALRDSRIWRREVPFVRWISLWLPLFSASSQRRPKIILPAVVCNTQTLR